MASLYSNKIRKAEGIIHLLAKTCNSCSGGIQCFYLASEGVIITCTNLHTDVHITKNKMFLKLEKNENCKSKNWQM